MKAVSTQTVVKRIGVAYAVYSLFWLLMIGGASFQIWKMTEKGAFSPSTVSAWTILTVVAYVLYFIPVLMPLVLIGYTSLTTWRLARREPSEDKFQNHIVRNVPLLFGGFAISLPFLMLGIPAI